jgi:hypothetical protein
LLDLAFLKKRTAKLNVLNTEFEGAKKTVIKIIGTNGSFKLKPKLS